MTLFNHATQFSCKKNHFLYLQGGSVKVDDSGWLKRTYYSWTGERDYDLSHVFRAAQSLADSQYKEENLQFLSQKLSKKVGLSSEQFQGMQRLTSALSGNEADCALLNKFFEKIADNRRFNAAVTKVLDFGGALYGVNREALEILRIFSFKMGRHKEFDKAYQKVVRIQGAMKKDSLTEELSDEEKLSLKELNMLEMIAKMKPIAMQLKTAGLAHDKHSFLGRMIRRINGTENFLSRIQNIIEKSPDRKESGLIFYDLENFAHKRTLSSNLFHTFLFRGGLRTNLFHASMQIAGSSRKGLREVHIWGKYIENRRAVSSYVFKTLNVDMEKVLDQFSAEDQEKLRALYGDEWKKLLKQKYAREVARFFENPKQFRKLRNYGYRRMLLGAQGRCSNQSCFQQSHEKQREFDPGNGATCSEFASKSIFHVFDLVRMSVVDDWLLHQKRQKNRESPNPPLLLSNVSSYINFSQISPSLMAQMVMKRDFGKDVPTPPILRQIARFSEFKTKDALSLPFCLEQIDHRGVIPNSCPRGRTLGHYK